MRLIPDCRVSLLAYFTITCPSDALPGARVAVHIIGGAQPCYCGAPSKNRSLGVSALTCHFASHTSSCELKLQCNGSATIVRNTASLLGFYASSHASSAPIRSGLSSNWVSLPFALIIRRVPSFPFYYGLKMQLASALVTESMCTGASTPLPPIPIVFTITCPHTESKNALPHLWFIFEDLSAA